MKTLSTGGTSVSFPGFVVSGLPAVMGLGIKVYQSFLANDLFVLSWSSRDCTTDRLIGSKVVGP